MIPRSVVGKAPLPRPDLAGRGLFDDLLSFRVGVQA